jgi:hypothetical protein
LPERTALAKMEFPNLSIVFTNAPDWSKIPAISVYPNQMNFNGKFMNEADTLSGSYSQC